MIIKLDFVNRNQNDDGTRVYRDSKPITSVVGLTPIATLPPKAQTYSDDTAVQGQRYYYAFETFSGDSSVLSVSVPVLATPYTGVGPQEMITGDYDRGYFGQVAYGDFISPDEVMTMVSGPTGTLTHSAYAWLKFAHQGKIVLIPHNSRLSTNWNVLYAAGLVYGTDGPGPEGGHGTQAEVEQNKTIVVNGDTYRVRTMRGLPEGKDFGSGIDASDVSNLSEYESLILGVFSGSRPAHQTWGTMATLGSINPLLSSSELLAEPIAINSTSIQARNATALFATTASSTSMQWRPVLELVV